MISSQFLSFCLFVLFSRIVSKSCLYCMFTWSDTSPLYILYFITVPTLLYMIFFILLLRQVATFTFSNMILRFNPFSMKVTFAVRFISSIISVINSRRIIIINLCIHWVKLEKTCHSCLRFTATHTFAFCICFNILT